MKSTQVLSLVIGMVIVPTGLGILVNEIQNRMEKDAIIPNILDKTPAKELVVLYSRKYNVDFGNELTPALVHNEPEVAWETQPDKYHTLVMFDPDAPTRQKPTFADVKHWLVGNVLGCDVNTGSVIAAYFGSGPPKGTGFHRYIFLVFEQKSRINFADEPKSGKWSRKNRLKWSLNDFRHKYQLGKIVAANYFKAQWDPFVDERNKFIASIRTDKRSKLL